MRPIAMHASSDLGRPPCEQLTCLLNPSTDGKQQILSVTMLCEAKRWLCRAGGTAGCSRWPGVAACWRRCAHLPRPHLDPGAGLPAQQARLAVVPRRGAQLLLQKLPRHADPNTPWLVLLRVTRRDVKNSGVCVTSTGHYFHKGNNGVALCVSRLLAVGAGAHLHGRAQALHERSAESGSARP